MPHPAAGAGQIGHDPGGADIVIGLVNLMPPAAAKTTENLFRRLLQADALPLGVRLLAFTPDQSDAAANPWNDEAGAKIDALIVTGTEPRAQAMHDEPCWPYLQKLCDWAAENTISTLWSCFAAHAAVLHMDGLQRRRMESKLSGLYACERAGDHFLAAHMPPQWLVPHSRHNTLAEAELRAGRYQVLSHAPRIGADSFTKRHGNSLFLFFQGHPEYSPPLLFGEYSRDVKRYFLGELRHYPEMPENYFDPATSDTLTALRHAGGPSNGVFPPALVKSVTEKLSHPWRRPTEQLYANWISYIAQAKLSNRNLHPDHDA